jgi:hypothetical protein
MVACLAPLVAWQAPALAQDTYAADMKAGRGAYNQSDWPGAQTHFEAALKGAENDRQKGAAIYALGVIAQKQNKLPEAKQRAEQALALNASDSQAKGLLDEVNAATAAPKGKGKAGAQKGLAKTPLAPSTKKTAAKPADATAADPSKPVAANPSAEGAAPAAEKAAPKPAAKAKPAAADATKTAKPTAKKPPAEKAPAAQPGEAPALPPTQPPAAKSGALPNTVQPGATLAAVDPAPTPPAGPQLASAAVTPPPSPAAASGGAAGLPSIVPPISPAATVNGVGVVTGSVAAAAGPLTTPTSTPAVHAPPAAHATLPERARFVEMACGLDYRSEDRLFARAYEITRGENGDQGEILSFGLACEKKVSTAGGPPESVPRSLIRAGKGDVTRATLGRTPGGGDAFAYTQGQKQIRVRLGADTLTVLPSPAEVAVLRKQLAENPAQLEALSPEARQNFERAVSGEGTPEFRAVRESDGLDAAFVQAGKVAKRAEGERTSTSSGTKSGAKAGDMTAARVN